MLCCRVWDCVQAKCLYWTKLNHAIISLAFHPTAHTLAIASGSVVHVWDYEHDTEARQVWSSQHTLRCVHFMPAGNTLIIGEANDKDPHQRSMAHLTVRLQLWDFDIEKAHEGDRGAGGERGRELRLRLIVACRVLYVPYSRADTMWVRPL